jgi:hypothetical protein
MAIAHDNTANDAFIGSIPSFTLSKTNTGSDLLLLVFVTVGKQGGDVSAVTLTCTYNGVSMTEARSGTSTGTLLQASSTTAGGCLFYLDDPATSAHDIVVTPSNPTALDMIGVGASSYTGVLGGVNGITSTTSNGATNSPGLAITSQTGDLPFCGASHGDTISGSGTGTNERYRNNANGALWAGGCFVGGDEAGAATTTIDFTSAVSDQWVMIGLNMAAGAPPATPALRGMIRSALRLR